MTDLMSDIRGGGDEKMISDHHSSTAKEMKKKKQNKKENGKKISTGVVRSQIFTQARHFSSEGDLEHSDFQLWISAHPSGRPPAESIALGTKNSEWHARV